MTILLIDKGDEQKIIESEKNEWVSRVLIAFGIPKEIIDKNNMETRSALDNLELAVWSNHDGTIDILRSGKTVAQWKEPNYILVNENGKLYYKITLNEWALPFQMG